MSNIQQLQRRLLAVMVFFYLLPKGHLPLISPLYLQQGISSCSVALIPKRSTWKTLNHYEVLSSAEASLVAGAPVGAGFSASAGGAGVSK